MRAGRSSVRRQDLVVCGDSADTKWVVPQDFDAIWAVRIGEAATGRLRTYIRVARLTPLAAVLAGIAGLGLGNGMRSDVVGGISAVGSIVIAGGFVFAQRRVATAMSPWFGVRLRWLPKMTPKRFDEWRHARGLMTPGERAGDHDPA
jgi:hypothetical protein